MKLDEAGLPAAWRSLDDNAVTPGSSRWREDIVRSLNDSLESELVCVLHYKRHHFTARRMASLHRAEEYMAPANAEASHADRIVQPGGPERIAKQACHSLSHFHHPQAAHSV